MHAAVFEAELAIPGAQSLKDKRMVIRSVKERCRSRFNVSVVESGENDKWQRCRLMFALAAISESAAKQGMQDIADFLYGDGRCEVLRIEILLEE
jgi:hypothetical protein